MSQEDTLHYRVGRLEDTVKEIRDNHLEHLRRDVNDLKNCQSGMKQDLVWLKKYFGIIATATIGSFIATIFGLL